MRNIRRNEKYENTVVNLLARASHPKTDTSIFPTYRDLLCFAAVLGFEEGLRKVIPENYVELDGRLFSQHSPTLDLFYLLGIAETKGVEVLSESEEENLILIFEEYANGGLEIMQGWLNEKPEDLDGDLAILTALKKYGYFTVDKNVDDIMDGLSF